MIALLMEQVASLCRDGSRTRRHSAHHRQTVVARKIVAMYFMYIYTKPMNNEHLTTGSLVWRLAMRWRNEVDRAIAPLGLTHAQYSALASLHSLSLQGIAPSQKQLSDYTGLQAIYISKLVRVLETAGYLLRTAHSTDSRAVALELSETGLKIIVEARQIVKALDGRLTQPLGGPGGERTRLLAVALRELIDPSQA